MTLSLADARRIALAAQGFGARPAKPTLRHVRGIIDRIELIQVDSVNVLVRSQELPLWARLGPHDRGALPALIRDRTLFEYWAHEASLLRVELQPLLRWRMAEARDVAWGTIRRLVKRDPGYIQSVRDEVHARGSLVARELESRQPKKKRGSTAWWGWDDRKRALAYLFWAGEITATRSATTFERIYTPLDRVIPAQVLATPTPDPDDARRELLLLAARAHGIGTLRDLADYFRIRIPVARPLVRELAAAGAIVETHVEGWREPAYLHPEAAPRAFAGRALLSPFDSLIWERARTHRLFDFHYRIEIYTPAHKRVHGYYVLPFLLDEQLVARVDLKADRDAGTLVVHAAHVEAGAPRKTASELGQELRAMATWLGLPHVSVARRGNLGAALRKTM